MPDIQGWVEGNLCLVERREEGGGKVKGRGFGRVGLG